MPWEIPAANASPIPRQTATTAQTNSLMNPLMPVRLTNTTDKANPPITAMQEKSVIDAISLSGQPDLSSTAQAESSFWLSKSAPRAL